MKIKPSLHRSTPRRRGTLVPQLSYGPQGTGPRVREERRFILLLLVVGCGLQVAGCRLRVAGGRLAEQPATHNPQPATPPLPPGFTAARARLALVPPPPLAIAPELEPVGFTQYASQVLTNQTGWREFWFINAQDWQAWRLIKTDDGTNWISLGDHQQLSYLVKKFIVSEPPPFNAYRNYVVVRLR